MVKHEVVLAMTCGSDTKFKIKKKTKNKNTKKMYEQKCGLYHDVCIKYINDMDYNCVPNYTSLRVYMFELQMTQCKINRCSIKWL